jgi:hypothetical protein
MEAVHELVLSKYCISGSYIALSSMDFHSAGSVSRRIVFWVLGRYMLDISNIRAFDFGTLESVKSRRRNTNHPRPGVQHQIAASDKKNSKVGWTQNCNLNECLRIVHFLLSAFVAQVDYGCVANKDNTKIVLLISRDLCL